MLEVKMIECGPTEWEWRVCNVSGQHRGGVAKNPRGRQAPGRRGAIQAARVRLEDPVDWIRGSSGTLR
jgi:hypothetical protein